VLREKQEVSILNQEACTFNDKSRSRLECKEKIEIPTSLKVGLVDLILSVRAIQQLLIHNQTYRQVGPFRMLYHIYIHLLILVSYDLQLYFNYSSIHNIKSKFTHL